MNKYCAICKKECSGEERFYDRPVHKECLEPLTQAEALKLTHGLKHD